MPMNRNASTLRSDVAADRFAVQSALMPYEHLLPPSLRARNERIEERAA